MRHGCDREMSYLPCSRTKLAAVMVRARGMMIASGGRQGQLLRAGDQARNAPFTRKRPAGRSPFVGIVRIRYWGSPFSLLAVRLLSLPAAIPVTRGLVRSSSLSRLAGILSVRGRDDPDQGLKSRIRHAKVRRSVVAVTPTRSPNHGVGHAADCLIRVFLTLAVSGFGKPE